MAGVLSVASEAGTASGDTKLTVTPALGSGNSYMIKTAASVTIPVSLELCNVAAGFAAWNGTADVTATTGNEILVVEVDSAFKAIKAGKATVTSKA